MTITEIRKLKRAFKPVKGEPGDPGQDGITPIKGKDYFTSKEIQEFKKDVTPIKGKDYFDGKDGLSIKGPKGDKGDPGKDGKSIIGPKGDKGDPGIGKPGKDGKDGNEIEPSEIVDKLESLVGDKRLDASAIKNLDKKLKDSKLSLTGFGGGSSGASTFTGLTDTPESYADNASKFVKVKADETGLEFTASTATVAWDGITGNQALINLSGFTNDSGFITAGDIPAIPTNADFDLADLGDVVNTAKAEGKILKVDAFGKHVYVDDESGTDEKVKYDSLDPTAGYLSDKIIAGEGITVTEGTAGDENKLVITNDDKGSDYVETDPLSLHLDQTTPQEVTGGKPKFSGGIDLNNSELDNANFVDFNTSYTDGNAEGRLQWNSEDGTLEVGMSGGNVNLQIGQEELIRVRNNSGVDIEDGQAVYITGSTGAVVTVALAKADADATSFVAGLATEDINNNSFGYITVSGLVRDVNTNSFTAGDPLYLSATTAGAITNVAPEAPNCVVRIGTCVIKGIANGSILVSIDNVPHLKDLCDVNGTPLATTGQIPVWNETEKYFDFDYNITDYAIDEDVKKYAGFENRTDSTIAMDEADFTITTLSSYHVWINSIGKIEVSDPFSIGITADQDLTFVYFDYFEGALRINASTTPWDIKSGHRIPVAIVFKDGGTYALTDERHGYNRNLEWHNWAHNNIGAMYFNGLAGTFTDTTLSIAQGVIYDEDIRFNTEETKTTTSLWYRNATGGMRLVRGSTTPYSYDGNLKWDNGSGTLQNVGANNYVCSWVYCSNDGVEPIYTVIGQANHANLNNARGEAQPIINLSTAEWKLLYRVIYRNTATPSYIETADFRNVQTGVAVSTTSPTSHTTLSNRDAIDSHPISAITDLTDELGGKLEDITAESVGDLSDVDLTGVTDNKILKWNTNKFVVADDENTTYQSSDFNHDDLTGYVANEHIDWTAESAGTINATNYVDNDTTYTAGDGINITELNVIENTDKGSDVSVPSSVGDLSDVDLTTIATGDLLQWDGTKFVKYTFSATGTQVPLS
jgi:hypothetical protein